MKPRRARSIEIPFAGEHVSEMSAAIMWLTVGVVYAIGLVFVVSLGVSAAAGDRERRAMHERRRTPPSESPRAA
jgi:hypothetical protein